jgi:hypothetical protein
VHKQSYGREWNGDIHTTDVRKRQMKNDSAA